MLDFKAKLAKNAKMEVKTMILTINDRIFDVCKQVGTYDKQAIERMVKSNMTYMYKQHLVGYMLGVDMRTAADIIQTIREGK